MVLIKRYLIKKCTHMQLHNTMISVTSDDHVIIHLNTSSVVTRETYIQRNVGIVAEGIGFTRENYIQHLERFVEGTTTYIAKS